MLTCARRGCAVGDAIERAGWGPDGPTPIIGAQPMPSVTATGTPTGAKRATHSLECRGLTGADWETLPGAVGFPVAESAGGAGVAWGRRDLRPEDGSGGA